VHHSPQPDRVLHREGLVEPQLAAQMLHFMRGRTDPKDVLDGATWGYMYEREHEYRETHQNWDK
jgi:hypothetical protein